MFWFFLFCALVLVWFVFFKGESLHQNFGGFHERWSSWAANYYKDRESAWFH